VEDPEGEATRKKDRKPDIRNARKADRLCQVGLVGAVRRKPCPEGEEKRLRPEEARAETGLEVSPKSSISGPQGMKDSKKKKKAKKKKDEENAGTALGPLFSRTLAKKRSSGRRRVGSRGQD